MILILASLLVKWFKLDKEKATKLVKVILIVIAGILLIVAILSLRSCFRPKIEFNEEQVQKVNSKNRAEAREELKEIIVRNADVIKTNDNRTLETETNVAERQRIVDEEIQKADAKVVEAQKNLGRDVTDSELECLLVPAHCE